MTPAVSPRGAALYLLHFPGFRRLSSDGARGFGRFQGLRHRAERWNRLFRVCERSVLHDRRSTSTP